MLLFSGCKKSEYEIESYLENKTIKQTFKQLKIEKGLIPTGVAQSVLEDNEYIELDFNYFKPLTIEEARELVIYSAKTFFNNLNSNEELIELRKKDYPMKMIRITIFVYNPDYSDIEAPGISLIKLKKTLIRYSSHKERFEKIYEETYQEALQKVKPIKTE